MKITKRQAQPLRKVTASIEDNSMFTTEDILQLLRDLKEAGNYDFEVIERPDGVFEIIIG